jgi:GGDEF domain-containing protein
VVLLRDTDEELASATAARLRTAIEGDVSLMDTAGVVLRVSASAGIALHQPGGTPQELLAAADAAMYDVKHRGA